MSLYTAGKIMEIIPHRPPFLMLDTIEELEAGKRVVGRKLVSMGEPCFQGHFPGNPVFPGVLIVEAMAQAGAVAILSQPEWQGKTAYFAALDKVRFLKPVLPGDELLLTVSIEKQKGPIGVGRGTASVNGEPVARAELTFAVK